MSKPPYVPAHYPSVWLSSDDVKQAIDELAEQGADKAFCWDMNHAINRLIAKERANLTQDKEA